MNYHFKYTEFKFTFISLRIHVIDSLKINGLKIESKIISLPFGIRPFFPTMHSDLSIVLDRTDPRII